MLVPSFELEDVALLDADGRTALQLPRVVVALSPRSLLRMGFEQLYIERPALDIRRAADGKLFIAGLPFTPGGASDGGAADWLFSQGEVVVRGGTVHWSDALHPAPPLALDAVDIVLRNRGWRHSLRLDATPPPDWGERFTLMGQLREPLLSVHAGAWERWSGQLYAMFPRVDVAQLRQHADLGDITLARGSFGTISLHPALSYQSSQYFEVINEPILQQKGYALLDAHLDYESADGHVTASAWVKNAAQQFYFTSRVDLLAGFGFIYNHIGNPRTYGITLGYKI